MYSKALAELTELIQKSHNIELKNDSMVFQLFSDGELTLTKGGELFGKRRTHQIMAALNVNKEVQEVLSTVMPLEQAGWKFIFVQTKEQAIKIRRAIIKTQALV
ncbi:hypothetical protein NVP2275O_145 [Vibrio phage 2.275.O._10N.286.54.E11]|nr:hypothetical protein NVP2275O_145 [Vibrio phage 2.275.O._10N.286.54.E11]